MTVEELINWLQTLDPEAEVMIRVNAYDYTILDLMDEWRGHPTLFALEAGK
jgi:hypothetical protein